MTTEIVYHSSDQRFDGFDLQIAAELRKKGTTHENSALGIWVTRAAGWGTQHNYGRYLYESIITVDPRKVMDLPLRSVQSERLSVTQGIVMDREVKYLRLLESDGIARLGVIIDPDIIHSWSLIGCKR